MTNKRLCGYDEAMVALGYETRAALQKAVQRGQLQRGIYVDRGRFNLWLIQSLIEKGESPFVVRRRKKVTHG